MAKSKETDGGEREALLSASASASASAATGDDADAEAMKTKKSDAEPVSLWLKIASCVVLLGFQISSTIFTQLSKSSDGTYPYNSVLLAATVEMTKLVVSSAMLVGSRLSGREVRVTWSLQRFLSFAIPGFCYFVSNNCMFLIIRELGPTTFQITNNLKILSTGLLMRLFLNRPLSWMQWRALALLFFGSVISEMTDKPGHQLRGTAYGYLLVLVNTFVAATASVFSEKLLKGDSLAQSDSIHWQNIQLYFYGVIYGMIPVLTNPLNADGGIYHGFNFFAWATVFSLSFAGLTISFILKYIDNIAKCFVAAAAMLGVALIHVSIEHETLPLRLVVSISLVGLALEMYHSHQ